MSQPHYSVALLKNNQITLSGVLRLDEPQDYTKVFAPLFHKVSRSKDPVVIDLSELSYLNAIGLFALFHLLNVAHQQGVAVSIIGNTRLSWQEKTLDQLQGYWESCSLTMTEGNAHD